MSALQPGARRPSLSKPSARALPAVPASSTSLVVIQRSQSGPRTLEASEAMRIASYMFRLSEELAPSVPMPTLMPNSSMRRMSAMPLPSRMLLPGLCATDAPRPARRFMSSSSSHTPCAAVKPGPTSPSASMCAASDSPYFFSAETACTLDSDRCVCNPVPYSRARMPQPFRKSSLQWSGTVGATAGRITSRSNFQPCSALRMFSRLVRYGARRRRSTSFCSGGGSASMRPGIASKKLRSATIGATTARIPASL